MLHPEGVCFVNIGDTYYSGNGQPHGADPRCSSRQFMRTKMRAVDRSGWDLPKKSLIGIPWKLAFEMQRRGWTLRSDIIWNRGNAFSGANRAHRPHRQYEHVFMFSKTRFYSFDRSALPEEDVWNIPIERAKRPDHNAPFPTELVRRCIEAGSPPGGKVLDPFVGSGTVLDVATSLGRHAVGVDMSGEVHPAGQALPRQNGRAIRPRAVRLGGVGGGSGGMAGLGWQQGQLQEARLSQGIATPQSRGGALASKRSTVSFRTSCRRDSRGAHSTTRISRLAPCSVPSMVAVPAAVAPFTTRNRIAGTRMPAAGNPNSSMYACTSFTLSALQGWATPAPMRNLASRMATCRLCYNEVRPIA